jgi:hypothetical protein
MSPRHIRTSRPVRSQRRKLIWSTIQYQKVGLAAATEDTPQNLLAPLTTGGIGIIGGTVMRVHLLVSCNAVNADTNPSFLWGMAVWDKNVASASSPTIGSDFNADYMMLRQISPGVAAQAVAFPANTPTGVLYGEEYDVKARRRLHEMADSLFVWVTNQGSVAENYSLFARTLVALP